jgi:DNA topoisomerase 2-associated protein PAT1
MNLVLTLYGNRGIRIVIPTNIVDQPVWQFFAALALHGVIEQHHVLVSSLREKILDNVLSVNKGWVHDEDERQTKLFFPS